VLCLREHRAPQHPEHQCARPSCEGRCHRLCAHRDKHRAGLPSASPSPRSDDVSSYNIRKQGSAITVKLGGQPCAEQPASLLPEPWPCRKVCSPLRCRRRGTGTAPRREAQPDACRSVVIRLAGTRVRSGRARGRAAASSPASLHARAGGFIAATPHFIQYISPSAPGGKVVLLP